jgi:hypothetical protein
MEVRMHGDRDMESSWARGDMDLWVGCSHMVNESMKAVGVRA